MMLSNLDEPPHERQRVSADTAVAAGGLGALHVDHQPHQECRFSSMASIFASHPRVPGDS